MVRRVLAIAERNVATFLDTAPRASLNYTLVTIARRNNRVNLSISRIGCITVLHPFDYIPGHVV